MKVTSLLLVFLVAFASISPVLSQDDWQAKYKAVESEKTTLQTSLKTAQNELSSLKKEVAKVADLEKQIASLQAELKNKEKDGSNAADLEKKMASLSSEKTKLSTKVSALETELNNMKESHKKHSTETSSLHKQIETLKAELAQKASSSALSIKGLLSHGWSLTASGMLFGCSAIRDGWEFLTKLVDRYTNGTFTRATTGVSGGVQKVCAMYKEHVKPLIDTACTATSKMYKQHVQPLIQKGEPYYGPYLKHAENAYDSMTAELVKQEPSLKAWVPTDCCGKFMSVLYVLFGLWVAVKLSKKTLALCFGRKTSSKKAGKKVNASKPKRA
eukprot:GILK01001676.1.p1 GENE.GILK01001676.1~~GILK01001676.1.p1  ORF type:complete len:329 (-),score=72.65 GILK01001676.1:207-1193(-)